MTKDEIIERLEELEIDHDKQSRKAELAALLPEGEMPSEDTVTCEVLRDFWPSEGNRVRKGSVVEVTKDEALDGVEAGALKRVKD